MLPATHTVARTIRVTFKGEKRLQSGRHDRGVNRLSSVRGRRTDEPLLHFSSGAHCFCPAAKFDACAFALREERWTLEPRTVWCKVSYTRTSSCDIRRVDFARNPSRGVKVGVSTDLADPMWDKRAAVMDITSNLEQDSHRLSPENRIQIVFFDRDNCGEKFINAHAARSFSEVVSCRFCAAVA